MRLRLAVLTLVVLAIPTGSAHAQDTDQVRFYFGGRSGEAFQLKQHAARGIEVSSGQQVNGFFLGVNVNRYLGAELTGDAYQTDLKVPGLGKVGEYGMFNLLPQARVRYPLFDDRLTPYLTGGVGVQITEFNDRKPPGRGPATTDANGKIVRPGLGIDVNGTSIIGSVGAGVEYFVADNVAIGADARYLISRGQELKIDGQGGHADLDALLATATIRLLFPEGPDAPRPYEPPDWRPYLGIRVGGQRFVNKDVGGPLQMETELSAIGGLLDQYFNISVGVDIKRYLGVEVLGEGFKGTMVLKGFGDVGKLSLYVVMPQVRARYPLMGNRLVPYALAGVGASYAEVHDLKPHAEEIRVKAENFGPVGALGLGVDYFLVRNIALGLETKYMIDRAHDVTLQGQSHHVNLDSVVGSLGVRVYFR